MIILPRVFDIEFNEEESLLVLSIFRRALWHHRRINYVDFSGMEVISPACAMILTSYADMWKMRAPEVSCLQSTWRPDVIKTMMDIGFFDYLHYEKPQIMESNRSLSYMKLRSYVKQQTTNDVGKKVEALIKDIDAFVGLDIDASIAYKSITEAVLNVYHHAYVGIDLNHLPRKWWLSVSYDKNTRVLGVIIYDHGIGIPEAMKRSMLFKAFRSFAYETYGLRKWGEKDRLKIAFDRNAPWRDRILVRKVCLPKGRGRGHGCGDIMRLVSACQGEAERRGRLIVFSGNARYEYNNDEGSSRDGNAQALACKLEGTLVEWKIQL